MLTTEFPVINGTVFTAIDTYNTAQTNNGAANMLGARFPYPPLTVPIGAPAAGQGVQGVIAYVQYKSTSNPNVLAQPGLVYWGDKSYTWVTGVSSEGAFGANGVAGYMFVNTTNYPGSLTGAQVATLLNPTPGSLGNFLWIAVGGYLPGATSAASVAAGDFLIGSGTAFTPARMVAGTAPTNRVVGMAATAVSSSKSDVNLSGGLGVF